MFLDYRLFSAGIVAKAGMPDYERGWHSTKLIMPGDVLVDNHFIILRYCWINGAAFKFAYDNPGDNNLARCLCFLFAGLLNMLPHGLAIIVLRLLFCYLLTTLRWYGLMISKLYICTDTPVALWQQVWKQVVENVGLPWAWQRLCGEHGKKRNDIFINALLKLRIIR